MAWQRLKVQIKGEDPVEIETNARDWASIDFAELQTAGALFRVCHNALLRTAEVNIPLNYDAFLEVLEGMPEAVDEADPLAPTPTGP